MLLATESSPSNRERDDHTLRRVIPEPGTSVCGRAATRIRAHATDAKASKSPVFGRFDDASRGGSPKSADNGKKATTTVTWNGCRRGEFFEGCDSRRGKWHRSAGGFVRTKAQETRRTPGSAAGCNKPASSVRSKPSRWCETTRAEQDFELVARGRRIARAIREWTHEVENDGGDERIPREEAGRAPARAS